MELEELKNIWNKNQSGFQPKNEEQLASMLKGNSRSIVDKLKRSVWFELSFTIIAGVGLLIYASMLPTGALKWTTIAIIILFVASPIYYIKKLLILNRFTSGNDNLKANLERLVASLSSYLKFYRRSYTVLYPVYLGLGILFGAIEMGSDRFFQKASDPKVIASLLALIVSFYFIYTLLANWLLKKLYGEHLQKLKGLLEELNTNEEMDMGAEGSLNY